MSLDLEQIEAACRGVRAGDSKVVTYVGLAMAAEDLVAEVRRLRAALGERQKRVDEALRVRWLALRDDASMIAMRTAQGCVFFARDLGLITQLEEELWARRLTTCPGHDDEGGRSWCAFCGDLRAEPPPTPSAGGER